MSPKKVSWAVTELFAAQRLVGWNVNQTRQSKQTNLPDYNTQWFLFQPCLTNTWPILLNQPWMLPSVSLTAWITGDIRKSVASTREKENNKKLLCPAGSYNIPYTTQSTIYSYSCKAHYSILCNLMLSFSSLSL